MRKNRDRVTNTLGLPANFVKSIPRIRKLISYYGLHNDVGTPVDIDGLLATLKIDVKTEPFEDFFLEGFSTRGKYGSGKSRIHINQDKSLIVQRRVKAHELHHILEHSKELPLFSHIGHENKILEREANYSAAFYLIPTYCINLNNGGSIVHQELAKNMQVPVDLVLKRYEIYLQLKEHNKDLDTFNV